MRQGPQPYTRLYIMCRRRPVLSLVVALVASLGTVINVGTYLHDRATPPKTSRIIYPYSPFPEGFEENTIDYPARDYCYLIVHPGYGTYTDMGEDVIGNVAAYGDYQAYLRNLTTLARGLRKRNVLVIFGLEERAAANPALVPDGLKPWDTSLLVVTRDHSGLVQRGFTDDRGIRRTQSLGCIVDFLRINGIKEIRVAGEAAWFPGPNGYRACLATLANSFVNEGFRVRGVRGCVYPTNPLPTEGFLRERIEADEWIEERWRGLYGNRPLLHMKRDPVLQSIYDDRVGNFV